MKTIVLLFALALTATAQMRGAHSLPPHDQIMRELQKVAQEKHVYYYVFCTALYEGDEEKFQAVATAGGQLNIYAEDGATNYWQVYGEFKTQRCCGVRALASPTSPTKRQATAPRQTKSLRGFSA